MDWHIDMENNDLIDITFDLLDEKDLSIILEQVSKRALKLRSNTPDSLFWINVLMRFNRWLLSAPTLNDEEKAILVAPTKEGVNAKLQVIKSLRQRSGMRLHACQEIVHTWMQTNAIIIKNVETTNV